MLGLGGLAFEGVEKWVNYWKFFGELSELL